MLAQLNNSIDQGKGRSNFLYSNIDAIIEDMNISVDSIDTIKDPVFESTAINYQAKSLFEHSKLALNTVKSAFEGDNDFFESTIGAIAKPVLDHEEVSMHSVSVANPSPNISSCGLIQPAISTLACVNSTILHDRESSTESSHSEESSMERAPHTLPAELNHPSIQAISPTIYSHHIKNQLSHTKVTPHSPDEKLPPSRTTDLTARSNANLVKHSPVIKTKIDACTHSLHELSPIHTSVPQKSSLGDCQSGRL